MNDMWMVFAILLIMLVLNHFEELRIRGKILTEINQNAPIGHIQTWVNAMYNRYRLPVFARRRDFYAELIFTEQAIFILRMLKFGPIKLHSNILTLVKNHEDIPQIADFWYAFQTTMYYKIDSLVIDGRRILIECSYVSPPNQGYIKRYEHKFLISDLRDNDAYKNVLLLNRYLQQKRVD
jgi:hypothetical protein